jgi:8-oxo-dGTP diphosphatase
MKTTISSSVIIYNDKNQVLLAKRSSNKKMDPNLWETIGGSIEFGESPIECLEREIKEELNSQLFNVELFGVYSYINKDNEIHVISIQYLAKIDKSLKFNKNEIAEIRWINEVDIPKFKFSMNCKERVLDYYKYIKNLV